VATVPSATLGSAGIGRRRAFVGQLEPLFDELMNSTALTPFPQDNVQNLSHFRD
jgi:hypothetical protein